jgi:riboflavin synthase
VFTGIIEAQGIITRVEKKDGGMELEIYAPSFGKDMKIGESISVDGVCLTAENFLRGAFVTHLTKETLDRSTLGKLKPSTKVNLERAMVATDRFGGHFVQGHVDAVGRVVGKKPAGGGTELTIDAPRELMPYLIEKGSIAVDGISLTVTRVTARGFSVVVIPHTELVTTLDGKGPGESVNLEADMMAKYVRRYVEEILGPEGAKRDPLAGLAKGED